MKNLDLSTGYIQEVFQGLFWLQRAFSVPPFCAPTLCRPSRHDLSCEHSHGSAHNTKIATRVDFLFVNPS